MKPRPFTSEAALKRVIISRCVRLSDQLLCEQVWRVTYRRCINYLDHNFTKRHQDTDAD